MRLWPATGRIRPAMQANSVLLSAPDGPTRPMTLEKGEVNAKSRLKRPRRRRTRMSMA
jgi:hypothetical protein